MDPSATINSAPMFIRSRIVGLVMLGLVFLAGSAWAQGFSIQGTVKGPDGKPVNGAEVQIKRKDSKGLLNTVKTSQKGDYLFKNLPLGIYEVTAWVNNVPTSIGNVKTRAEGVVRVDFDIKPAAAAASRKKVKHYVWIPARTGSHLGGKSVEVDENGNIVSPGTENVDQVSGDALSRLHGRGVGR